MHTLITHYNEMEAIQMIELNCDQLATGIESQDLVKFYWAGKQDYKKVLNIGPIGESIVMPTQFVQMSVDGWKDRNKQDV